MLFNAIPKKSGESAHNSFEARHCNNFAAMCNYQEESLNEMM